MSKFRNFLKLLPDKVYIQIQYHHRFKRFVNFRNPQTFNEKIQWLKIHDRKPIYTSLVDKCAVKRIMADLIGEDHIIPTFGVWKRADDIDYDSLPDRFVLKANHDSGSVVVCRDKRQFDKQLANKKLNAALNTNFYWYGREWPYKNVKPCIFAEEYIEEKAHLSGNKPMGLIDFKFFCFNGKPKFVYVSKGLENHSSAQISFYDLEGNEMSFHRSDFAQLGSFRFPPQFREMCKIAEKIATFTGNPFARVDLYCVGGKILFSEITFHPGSGLLPFVPSEWDYKIGQLVDLSALK